MSNPSYIRSGLVRRGLPEHVADAFMVNFRDESGLNPGINEAKPLVPGSRGGFGLYQLTGPRRREYEAFAAQRGVQPADVDAQLDFLMGELSGSEKRAGQRILAAPDTATAAQAIVNDFLRPAASHRTKRSAQYASLGGAPMALGPEPSPSGATSAIQSVMADRSAPSPSPASSGGSMAAPTINIGPKKSSKIQEAMMARALAGGENIRHPLELVGNLAQVWAANRGIKANEAEEASALQKVMASANLDPAYALAAQLGGDRESLSGAILSQQSDRAQAAQRAEDAARRQEETAYQRGRDTVSDQRWQAEQARLAQGTLPAGYRRTATGLEAIPGGPADPAVVGAGGGDLGLNPQYGVDAEGNPVLLQLGKNGTVVQSQMPDGVSLAKEPIRLDAGTHFVLLDPITRQPVGTIPKENRQEAAETAAGTVEGRTAAERAVAAPGDAQSAQNALDLIADIRDDPYRQRGTGASSLFNSIPGTGGFDFQQKVEQAKGGAFLSAIQQMRGMGALSNAEGAAATQAITRMNTAASEEGFLAALADYEKIVQQALTRAQGNMAPQQPQRGPMNLGATPNSVQLDEVTVPAGVDPADWEYMTPEERRLFQ